MAVTSHSASPCAPGGAWSRAKGGAPAPSSAGTGFAGFIPANIFPVPERLKTAAARMLKSKWANQVGKRATELAKQMETGEWQS